VRASGGCPGWIRIAGGSQGAGRRSARGAGFPRPLHPRSIRRVAFVTDAPVLTLLPGLAEHFVAAQVRYFRHADREAATGWLAEGGTT